MWNYVRFHLFSLQFHDGLHLKNQLKFHWDWNFSKITQEFIRFFNVKLKRASIDSLPFASDIENALVQQQQKKEGDLIIDVQIHAEQRGIKWYVFFLYFVQWTFFLLSLSFPRSLAISLLPSQYKNGKWEPRKNGSFFFFLSTFTAVINGWIGFDLHRFMRAHLSQRAVKMNG